MAKKVLFVFAGTGVKAQSVRDFTERETFGDDVIRVYFNGCQDEHIGGYSKIKGYLDPNLEVVANKIRHSFSSEDDKVTLKLADLKNKFGNSIIIEPKEGLHEAEEIDDITLCGFSRGAVTTFATAQALDDLDTPISLLAEDPVPGDTRAATANKKSIYAKNFDLSHCKNIVRGEVLLGTYSKHNKGWENKWFRQMAPMFNITTHSHIFMVPKKMHVEFNRRATTYSSEFLYNRGLTTSSRRWCVEFDREYVIPKVEQQKFHFCVVGRAEYLPSYKISVLRSLESKYNEDNPCPIDEDSKFKFGQALLALHITTMEQATFKALSEAILEDTDKGKGLREFIVEMDSIVQYSKEQKNLNVKHLQLLSALENNIYQAITDFQKIENPTLKQQEIFVHTIQSEIELLKNNLPNKVYNKLNNLTTLLLNENTLTHPYLVRFIDENETFSSNFLTADQRPLDGVVTNAEELSQKLFHSSVSRRIKEFEQEKKSLPQFINNVSDLAKIAPFLTLKQLKEALEVFNDKIKTVADVLLLMETLPTYKHQKMIYSAIKEKFVDMEPTFDEFLTLMEYLSDKKCQKLCEIIPIQELPVVDLMKLNNLIEQRLTDNIITLLKGAVGVIAAAPKEIDEPITTHKTKVKLLASYPARVFQSVSTDSQTSASITQKSEQEESSEEREVHNPLKNK